jgi:glycolate oxidase FAD binding subunit
MRAPLLSADSTLVQFADEIGDTGPVAIEGGRTRWDVGGPLRQDARLVRAPSGVVQFQPEEMTVVVRAGTSVSELEYVLKDRNQRCALPNRGGTVGGAIVVGENDLAVFGKGSVRASVLEVRYVSSEGRLIRGGGPTVKNVTGFDLPRLMVGSLGTLSCIAEVILRTNPIPAVSKWYQSDDVDPFATFASLFRPSAVLWDGRSTWVLLEGHSSDVDDQVQILSRFGRFEEVDNPPQLPSHRWSLAPTDIRTLHQHSTGKFVASIGVGTVFAEKPQVQRQLSSAVSVISERLKSNFDPTVRLNPGRSVGVMS